MPSLRPNGGASLCRGLAGTLGVCAVLACALAGTATAKDYASLDHAVSVLAWKLVKEAGLREKKVLVSPRNFVFAEQETECSLPLSKDLADKFASQISGYGAQVVSLSEDKSWAITLRGEWNVESVESGEERLHLSLKVTQLDGDDEVLLPTSAEGRAPLAGIDEKRRKPDLDYHGCNVVKRLEGGTRGDRPRTVYVQPPSVSTTVTPQPERLGQYLADWLTRALGQSSRFQPVEVAATLDRVPVDEQISRSLQAPGAESVPGTGRNGSLIEDIVQADAVLAGEVIDDGERIEVAVKLRDRRSGVVVAAAERLDKGLLPDGLFREPDESVRQCREWIPPESAGPGLDLATNRGEGFVTVTSRPGDGIRFIIRAHRRSWLYLFNVNPDCRVIVLQRPSRAMPDLSVTIPPADTGPITVAEPYGVEIVFAVATAGPADLPPELAAATTARSAAGLAALRAWLDTLRERGHGGYAQAQVVVATAP